MISSLFKRRHILKFMCFTVTRRLKSSWCASREYFLLPSCSSLPFIPAILLRGKFSAVQTFFLKVLSVSSTLLIPGYLDRDQFYFLKAMVAPTGMIFSRSPSRLPAPQVLDKAWRKVRRLIKNRGYAHFRSRGTQQSTCAVFGKHLLQGGDAALTRTVKGSLMR